MYRQSERNNARSTYKCKHTYLLSVLFHLRVSHWVSDAAVATPGDYSDNTSPICIAITMYHYHCIPNRQHYNYIRCTNAKVS